jgi:uncharacterized protein YkwD
MIRIIGVILSLLLFASLFGTSRAIESSEYVQNAQEAELIALINAYRVANGLNPLTPVQELGASARHKSVDLGENDYFDHTSPEGVTFGDLLSSHGFALYGVAGENLAGGQVTATDALNVWINSPGHNDNMLGAEYDYIGVGYAFVEGSLYGHYWTLHLGSDGVPNGVPTQPTAVPTEVVIPPTEVPVVPTEVPVYPTEIPTYPTEVPTYPTEVPVHPTEVPAYPKVTVTPEPTPGTVNQLPNTGTGSVYQWFDLFE